MSTAITNPIFGGAVPAGAGLQGGINVLENGMAPENTRADNTAALTSIIEEASSGQTIYFGEERVVLPIEDNANILLDKDLTFTGKAILQGDPSRTPDQKDIDTLFALSHDIKVEDLRFEKLGRVFNGRRLSRAGLSKPNTVIEWNFVEWDDCNFPITLNNQNSDYQGEDPLPDHEIIDLWRVVNCKVTNGRGGFQARVKKFNDIAFIGNRFENLHSYFTSSETGMTTHHGRPIRIGRDHPSSDSFDAYAKKVKSCRLENNYFYNITTELEAAVYGALTYVDNVTAKGNILDHFWQEAFAATEWDSGTTYPADSTVAHNGRFWKATTENTDSEPTEDNTDWEYNITNAVSGIYFRGPNYLAAHNYFYDCSTGQSTNGMIHVKSNAQGGLIDSNWFEITLGYWKQIPESIPGVPIGPIGVELEKTGIVSRNRFLNLAWPINTGATGTPLMKGVDIVDNVFDVDIDATTGIEPRNVVRLANDENNPVSVSNNRFPHGGTIELNSSVGLVIIEGNKVSTTTQDKSLSSFSIFGSGTGPDARIFIRGNTIDIKTERGDTHYLFNITLGGKVLEIVDNYVRSNEEDTGRLCDVKDWDSFVFENNRMDFHSRNFRMDLGRNVTTRIRKGDWIYRGSDNTASTLGLINVDSSNAGDEYYVEKNEFEIITAASFRNLYRIDADVAKFFFVGNRSRGQTIDRVARMNAVTITDFRFEDNRLPGAGWALFDNGVTVVSPIVRGNEDTFVTEKRDKATIQNGNTSVQVAHGLDNRGIIDWAPEYFRVTYLDSLGSAKYVRVSAADNTNVTFACDVDPGQDVEFAWEAAFSP